MKNVFFQILIFLSSFSSFAQCPKILDIDNIVGWGAGPLSNTGADQWQSFTNMTTGKLTRINLLLNDDPFTFTLSIYEGNGVGGQLLYTDNYTLAAGTWTDVDLPVASAPILTAGLQYTFRIQSGASFNSYVQDGDPYSGGVCFGSGGLQTGWDMNFKTYIQQDLVPQASFSVINNVSCFGNADGSIETSVTSGHPQYTFQWSPSNQTTQSATGLSPGNHLLVVTDTESCVDSISTTLTEPADIVLDAGEDETICIGQSVNLDAIATNASNFTWENSPSLSSEIIPNPIATPTITTQYIVTVENTPGCSKSDSISVIVDTQLPAGVSAGVDQEICKGFEVVLLATGGVSYYWSGPGIPAIIDAGLSAVIDSTAFYYVDIKTDLGCVYSDSVLVTIIDDGSCSLLLSNTITPNNDGVNDYWLIEGIEAFEENSVTIYNRWGDAVYEGT